MSWCAFASAWQWRVPQHQRLQLLHIGLQDEGVRAGRECSRLKVLPAGERDDTRRGVFGFHLADEVYGVSIRKTQIHDHDRRMTLPEDRDRFLSAPGSFGFVGPRTKQLAKPIEARHIVVDGENLLGFHGRSTVLRMNDREQAGA